MEHKTKEQIWKEQENNPDLCFSDSALIAMEEYGNQERKATAIGLLTWISENGWEWSTTKKGMWIQPESVPYDYLTTEQLSDLYLQSISK